MRKQLILKQFLTITIKFCHTPCGRMKTFLISIRISILLCCSPHKTLRVKSKVSSFTSKGVQASYCTLSDRELLLVCRLFSSSESWSSSSGSMYLIVTSVTNSSVFNFKTAFTSLDFPSSAP